MRIVQLSDTHGKHHLLKNLPEGDVIVHCGDFTEDGTEEEVLDFLNWFIDLPYRHKIFITGTTTCASGVRTASRTFRMTSISFRTAA